MITILRSAERHHDGPADRGTWESFTAGAGLGALTQLDEHRLAPGSGASSWFATGELVTYIFDGSMAWEDSLGGVGVLRATEIQVIVDGSSPHMVRNASQHAWVKGFQLTFQIPLAASPVPRVQHRFSAAERRGHLHIVAASDVRAGSMLLRARARIYSGLLSAGRHVVHELQPDRAAWLGRRRRVHDGRRDAHCRRRREFRLGAQRFNHCEKRDRSLAGRRLREGSNQ